VQKEISRSNLEPFQGVTIAAWNSTEHDGGSPCTSLIRMFWFRELQEV
jgi:hypothetical protein